MMRNYNTPVMHLRKLSRRRKSAIPGTHVAPSTGISLIASFPLCSLNARHLACTMLYAPVSSSSASSFYF